MSLEDEIRERGAALGFHRVGIASAVELQPEHERYRAFIDAGMHGEMTWLADNSDSRRTVDTESILLGARSVVVCALAYRRADVAAVDAAGEVAIARGPEGARIAQYARGADYHGFFRRKLRKFAAWMRTRMPEATARPIVDTAPVLERAWAQRAGVGFVGKNGCVIAPGLGSFVMLGEVITSALLEPDEALESRCGSCTLCLDTCPTRAFPAPFVLDARRCVAYLTIELRTEIPVTLRDGIGDRLFGCDDCQDVCPYNKTAIPDECSTAQFALDPRWREVSVEDIARADEAGFEALTAHTPLSRPGRAGLARNAVLVMGNSGDRSHLGVLHEVAVNDPDAMVRDAARWAIAKLG